MKWNRIVDGRANFGLSQILLQRVPIFYPYDIQMVDGARPLGTVRPNNALYRGKQFIVSASCFPALAIPIRKMPHLYRQETGLHSVKTAVVTFHVVIVLLRLTMVAQHSNRASYTF